MEASALRAPAGIGRSHISVGTPLLRLRSDEQLVALFRAGHEDAFRVIHDRYRQRLLAYTRQMLPCRQDAEDALQDVFVRAYSGLRANDRELALRAWLYRVAHNRCIDELRRPLCSPPEVLELVSSRLPDPLEEAERRESLRRLVADVRRLPDQQRSALLMRELSGMSYNDLAGALGVSVAAVKSLLVRARIGLVQSSQARETACSEIREELTLAHDRGTRPNATARRHMRDCGACRGFRHEIRGTSRQLAALAPAIGPLGVAAQMLGLGAGGSSFGTGAVAGGTTGAVAGSAVGATHVATLLAAAVVTAGGAVEIDHTFAAPPSHRPAHHRPVASGGASQTLPIGATSEATSPRLVPGTGAGTSTASPGSSPAANSTPSTGSPGHPSPSSPTTGGSPADVAGTGGTSGPGTPGQGSSTSGGEGQATGSGGVSSGTGATGGTGSTSGTGGGATGSSGGSGGSGSGAQSSGATTGGGGTGQATAGSLGGGTGGI